MNYENPSCSKRNKYGEEANIVDLSSSSQKQLNATKQQVGNRQKNEKKPKYKIWKENSAESVINNINSIPRTITSIFAFASHDPF